MNKGRIYVTSKDLYRAYKEENEVKIHNMKYCYELWIDDIGREPNGDVVIFGNRVIPMEDVLDKRDENEYGLTHYTNNLAFDPNDPQSLSKRYGSATFSRIKRNSNKPIILNIER